MLKVYRRTQTAKLPTKAHKGDAGWDLYFDSNTPLFIDPHTDAQLPTGISVVIGEDEVALLQDISEVSKEQMVSVEAGLITTGQASDNIMVTLHNRSGQYRTIQPFQRIAKLLILKFEPIDSIEVVE